MAQVSGFNVLQSVVKLVLGVGLILAGFGVYGAISGHITSYLIEGFAATLAIYLLRTRSSSGQPSHFFADLRAMVGYGLPLFTGSIISGLASQYATVILAAVVANAAIGYYQAALNVTVAITIISGAVANALFRSFAELHGLEEDIALAFAYAVRYVSLILTPMVFFILAGAGPLFDLFYGSAYSQGIVLLKLVAISYLPVAVGLTVLPSFFNGVGRSRFTMLISVSAAVALVLASLVFVFSLGLGAEGIMLALLVSNLASVVPGLFLSRRYLKTHVAVRPLLGIFSAGLVAWLVVAALPLGGLLSVEGLLVDAVVFVAAYTVLVPIFFGLDEDDLVRLSIAVNNMGSLKFAFGVFLGIERRILRLRVSGTDK